MSLYVELLAGYDAANVSGAHGAPDKAAALAGDALALLDVAELLAPPVAGPWADLGSGGGLPGIPLALALPDVRVTLIEAVGRKCTFLREAVVRLGLDDRVEVACARSEELTAPGASGREAFALVLAKAVGSLAVVVELAAPALRRGGLLLVSKTAAAAAREAAGGEAAAAGGEAAAARCGLAARRLAPLPRSPLPGSVCVVYEKVAPTPGRIPRRPGMAAKRPLA